MASATFLYRFIKCNMPFVHGLRRSSLCAAAHSLMDGAQLTLSALGRRLGGETLTKHKIKRVDRLLGNPRLHVEREAIYKAMAHWALAGRSRPVLAVDWSDMESGNRYQMLKAAVVVEGRALTLYEEVHPVKGCKRGKVERLFVRRLASLVPAQCTPIIVTDAGFLGPWFKAVRALGWDYVGRVRGEQKIQLTGEKQWRPIKELHALATRSARSLGRAFAARRHSYETRVCLVQEFKAKPGRRRSDRATHPKWREPWVLFTSLDEHLASAAVVANVYRKRMQIEEVFRDMKAPRFGFAMHFARSRTIARRQALLLIAALAMFELWLTGLAARVMNWQRHFQANTESSRHVLSALCLGREVHRHRGYRLTEEIMDATADLLRLHVGDLQACRGT